MTIGKRIQHARKAKKLTQKELAAKLELATGSIQQYELDKRQPRIEQLQSIANILEVPLSYLVGSDNEDKSGKTETFQPLTQTDRELLRLGGFSAFAEFYNLSAEDQQKAAKEIDSFVSYVVDKYKKQQASASPKNENPPQDN